MTTYNISIDEVKQAYRKLKTHIYNSNSDILLRRALAIYEDEQLDQKLDKFTKKINDFIIGKEAISTTNLIQKFGKINYSILPKISHDNNDNNDNIFRNDFNEITDEINLDEEKEINYFFHASLEYYLIDVLWIIKEGYCLIDNEIKKNCYGNTLCQDSESFAIEPGIRLFERYIDKYQAWRDNGIKIAKQQIENKNNVLLLCLDFKRFFPSSNINFEKIKNTIKGKKSESQFEPFLTVFLENIYKEYNKIVSPQKDRIQLPIGLFSSRVIANWYLSEFDVSMKKHFMPIYYGRYVDDIFMVISNITPGPKENIQTLFEKKFNIDKEGSPLKKIGEDYCYNIDDNLKFNNKKVKFFFFSADHSIALLNNFIKQIEKNSSAFWLLPEADDETFEDKAYNIDYKDTINKFRAVSGIQNNKYGAAIFFAKNIKLAILSSKKKDHRLTKKIFNFFSGKTLLEMNNLWEKVYTYFVAIKDKKSILSFYNIVNNAIDSLCIKDSEEKTQRLHETLKDVNFFSLSMAISLNYDTFSESEFTFINDDFSLIDIAKKIRHSYLSRHQYLPLPSIVFSENSPNNIIDKNIIEKYIKNNYKIEFETIKEYRIPRLIRYYEKTIISILDILRKGNGIIESEELCEIINNSKPNDQYNIIEIKSNESKYISSVTIKSNSCLKKIKIGLSNIKLNNDDITKSMNGYSNIGWKKLQRHNSLLNLATKEKVNCFVLPETSVPWAFLFMYAEHAIKKQQLIIMGLEHILIKNYCYNFSVVLIPFTDNRGIKDVLPLFRLKNHYSPKEQKEILKYYHEIPKNSDYLYYLIKSHGISFTIFNCYELADITHRALFKSNIDILFAIEYNKDIPYFSNIVESTCRDLHCYFVQANTSEYGDSRISLPKKTIEMTPVKVKGGENDTILTYELDIEKLRDFQRQNVLYQNDEFKNTPPGFDYKKVDER